MASSAIANAESSDRSAAGALSFQQVGGVAAVLTGVAGFLYAVAFIILDSAFLSALFLLLVGLCSTAALVALYERLRAIDGSFALWAVLLGLLGAAGSAIHGGYDLANRIHPPAGGAPDLPSQVDPRGLLTFGVASVALLVFAWLAGRDSAFPRRLASVGYLAAALLLVLYLGRLIILRASNPVIVVPALLNGFVVAPLWYLWLGRVLWRDEPAGQRR